MNKIYVNAEVTASRRADYVNNEDYEDVYANESNLNSKQSKNCKQGFGRACYIVSTVCLLLLCILLLTATIIMWMRCSNLQKEKGQLQKQNDELQKTVTNIDTLCKGRLRIFNSSTYYISTEKRNWTESRRDCRERGSDLVIINNLGEEEFLLKEMKYNIAWLGLSDRETEGEFRWVDDTPLTTSYWLKDEPNNLNNEDCAQIWGFDDNQGWNDTPCSHDNFWICEKK